MRMVRKNTRSELGNASKGSEGGSSPGGFRRWVVRGLWLGLVVLAGARAASAAAPVQGRVAENQGAPGAAEAEALKTADTLIYPNDLIYIQVFDVDQMSREYRVSPSGTLVFPLLADPVRAAGLTPEQLAALISQKCIEAGVLSHPQMSITIRESRVHAVSIAGAVKNPQVYPVFGRMTLMDVLTQAGGPAEDAGATVTIVRGEVGRKLLAEQAGGSAAAGKAPSEPLTVDLRRLLETGDPASNVDIYPGDRITVQRAGVVYVLGAVNVSGGFLLTEGRQNMTVLKAIALANSLKSTAKGKKALLLRPSPTAVGGRELISVDLNAMLRGRVPDRPMQANDILFVPDSAALKALYKSADVAATTAGYAAIVYH